MGALTTGTVMGILYCRTVGYGTNWSWGCVTNWNPGTGLGRSTLGILGAEGLRKAGAGESIGTEDGIGVEGSKAGWILLKLVFTCPAVFDGILYECIGWLCCGCESGCTCAGGSVSKLTGRATGNSNPCTRTATSCPLSKHCVRWWVSSG